MATSIDTKAFHAFSYGLFLLASQNGGRDNACIVNTAVQAASEPRQVSVACIKGSCTQEMIDASGRFCLSVLTQSTPLEYFEHFGMKSGHDAQKFAASDDASPGANPARTASGLAYEKTASAFFDCRVVNSVDMGSHVMYVGEVVEARCLSDEAPITYDYYRSVTRKRGASQTATPNATTDGGARISAWKCTICGYIYEGENLPPDFICPICKHGAEDFEPIYASAAGSEYSQPAAATPPEPKSKGVMNMETKWVCKVCGYIYEGAEPPAECPVCHAPASAFKKLEGEQELAAEHEYNVYDKTVKNNDAVSDEDKAYILEQLKANFNGECSEVGMYLCMARIAHREGYPEIGLYWEKAAYEEAEHAAKFAEMLGEDLEPNMKASTKENLAWRVECEYGACNGKTELATCAKKNGLDAIHDTVHEMARDEARHGRALKGLLDRYFG